MAVRRLHVGPRPDLQPAAQPQSGRAIAQGQHRQLGHADPRDVESTALASPAFAPSGKPGRARGHPVCARPRGPPDPRPPGRPPPKSSIDGAELQTNDEVRTRLRNEQPVVDGQGKPVDDSEVPDDVWKRYRNGDRSVFARRLFKSKDACIIPAIEQRYKRDDKFQDMVDRYLAKFENLLSHSASADPESVLSAAFITADVGSLPGDVAQPRPRDGALSAMG